jgi:hypothetical protein
MEKPESGAEWLQQTKSIVFGPDKRGQYSTARDGVQEAV